MVQSHCSVLGLFRGPGQRQDRLTLNGLALPATGSGLLESKMFRKPLSTLLLLVFPGLASAENMGPASGFVLALAKAVLRQGHRVVIAALNTAAVQDLADPFPHTAIVAALDSTKPDDIARIVREAKDRFGSVDVLVNTAGVGYIPAVEEGNREGISRQIHINFSDLTAT